MESHVLLAAKFLVLLGWCSLIYLPTRMCSYYRATSASQLCVSCVCVCVCVCVCIVLAPRWTWKIEIWQCCYTATQIQLIQNPDRFIFVWIWKDTARTYFPEPILEITSYFSSFFTASETLIDVSDSIPVLVRHHKYLYTAFRVTYAFSLSSPSPASLPPSWRQAVEVLTQI